VLTDIEGKILFERRIKATAVLREQI